MKTIKAIDLWPGSETQIADNEFVITATHQEPRPDSNGYTSQQPIILIVEVREVK